MQHLHASDRPAASVHQHSNTVTTAMGLETRVEMLKVMSALRDNAQQADEDDVWDELMTMVDSDIETVEELETTRYEIFTECVVYPNHVGNDLDGRSRVC